MSVARHTTYNVIGAIVPLAVLLITVPLYLSVIGLERYGILAICWLLVGYFNLFDFGLGRATAQMIATLHSASSSERSRILWTGAALSVGLAILAMAAFLPLARLALPLMAEQGSALQAEIEDVLLLLVVAIPLSIFQSLLRGALEGRREFLTVNLISSAGTIATGTLPLLAGYFIDVHLRVLVLATLLSRIAVVLLFAVAAARAVPLHRPRVATRAEFGTMLRFGGWTTVTNIVGPVMVYFDRFLIGALLGAAAVALYVVPFNLVMQLAVLPAAFATALFPRIAGTDESEAKMLSEDAVKLLACILTPTTLLVAAVLGPFLDIWLGRSAAEASAPVAYVLLFGLWANGLARVALMRLQARGRPDLPAMAHVAEVIPYVAFLYGALTWFGLAGAAIVWSLRALVDAIILAVMNRLGAGLLAALARQAILVLAAILVCLTMSYASALYWLALAVLAAGTAILLLRDAGPQLKMLMERLPLSQFRLERTP